MKFDHWIVEVGTWHFGPFGADEAEEYAQANGGRSWPLWEPEETDALTGRKAAELAAECSAGEVPVRSDDA